METETLLAFLDEMDRRAKAPDFLAGLAERKLRELEFHNLHRDGSREAATSPATHAARYGNRKFYTAVEASVSYVQSWIESHVPGKIFLDYACGNGAQVLAAARSGAALSIGLDISDVSVENGRRAARGAGLSETCRFVQGDCESTGLPDGVIDTILCSGMLHHLDLHHAYPELRRILKPGGRILAVEALDYNPVIKLYRRLTPEMRTDWERDHILSLRDLKLARRYFRIGEVRFWHMLSVLGAYAPSERARRPLLQVLNRVDALLTRVPALRLWSWQFTFELIRPETPEP
jgi:SAM-dependent methyltransferase